MTSESHAAMATESAELKEKLAHRDSKCALSTCEARGIHSPFGVGTDGCFCFCAEHAQMFKNAWVPRAKLVEVEKERDELKAKLAEAYEDGRAHQAKLELQGQDRFLAAVPHNLREAAKKIGAERDRAERAETKLAEADTPKDETPYERNERLRLCQECGKPGKHRIDNGLGAGTHCDPCWDELVANCRRRSW